MLKSFWTMFVLLPELLNKSLSEDITSYTLMKKAYMAVQVERRNLRDLIGGLK